MVGVYALYTADIKDDEQLQTLYDYLTPERLKGLKKIRTSADRIKHVFVELVYRYAIQEHFGIPTYAFDFRRDVYGKPYTHGQEGVHFNISHSGDWLVCAVDIQPVGIDIEKIYPIDSMHMAMNCFTPQECLMLAAAKDARRTNQFFNLWTMKESTIKLMGKGLSLPLNTFSIDLTGNTPVAVNFDGKQLAWIRQYHLEPSYSLSVSSGDNQFQDKAAILRYTPSNLNISSLWPPSAGGVDAFVSAIFSK